jgi:probable phosphoglycerate mutase
LLLVRHGQSEWNAQRRWQGIADSPLTAGGRAQAHLVAQHLRAATERFEAVWSSDLSRAAETAAIIAGHLGLGPVQLDERLREAHAGPWQGLTPADIEAEFPGYLAAKRRPEGFESPESVLDRALAVVADLAAFARQAPLLVVSHSGLIRTLRRSLGADDERVDNLGGQWLVVDEAGLRLDDTFAVDLDPQGSVDSGSWQGTSDESEDPGQSRRAKRHLAR